MHSSNLLNRALQLRIAIWVGSDFDVGPHWAEARLVAACEEEHLLTGRNEDLRVGKLEWADVAKGIGDAAGGLADYQHQVIRPHPVHKHHGT